MLIFQEILKSKQDYYEKDKNDPYPFNSPVVFQVKIVVLFIRNNKDPRENEYEYGSKNELPGAEHNVYFSAKLRQIHIA